ncbi:hypothetical protein HMN09_00474800 [Mycena chlorophos]|uniref:Uncharacterized protein n=1 Tax=Mycena chlorophos TaxID=658473 RepID=A0A8H6TH23_MYCCL|nr:hypothetical protein HMN09_00474800 [Mycena chlorophos]
MPPSDVDSGLGDGGFEPMQVDDDSVPNLPLPPRRRQPPARYQDRLPERVMGIDAADQAPERPHEQQSGEQSRRTVRLIVRDTFRTLRNSFSLWRAYLHRPTYDPDSLLSDADLSNEHSSEERDPTPAAAPSTTTPSVNPSVSLLMSWQNNGNVAKSAGELNALVRRRTGRRRQPFPSARDYIYRQGLGVGSTKVEEELKATSSVPTNNAFITRLGPDFELHRMLVVDFMHEFELGVWKNLFTHLIRLLYALPDGVSKVAELDRRYRAIPTFGTDTIRRFANNASEMKKLGARDFEDLLQCAIPAFDGLFPDPHNKRILTLLFRMAEWHAFAKLRMHTDPTLEHLKRSTSEIGRLMRDFRLTTCEELAAYELPREEQARSRAAARKASKAPTDSATPVPPPAPSGKRVKMLNLSTYKWHSLGDYPPTIPLFGTTDIYSTRYGEALHRQLKRMYAITNKNDHTAQIGTRVTRLHRARLARHVHKKKLDASARKTGTKSRKTHNNQIDDPFGAGPSQVHYTISDAQRAPIDIFEFSGPLVKDPALKNFVPKLQKHLLGRLRCRPFDSDDHNEFTADDLRSLIILNNYIYSTQTLRINYTTYDVRRDQDVLNVHNRPFVMLRSATPDVTPYWYAQLLGVYKVVVCILDLASGEMGAEKRMDVLFVRWMGQEPGYHASIARARLPKVGFVPDEDENAFGFLDPDLVIRAAHLVPEFAGGKTNYLLDCIDDSSIARMAGDDADYQAFYVNIFPDRDMIMRFVGGGIGHLDTRELTGRDIEQQVEDESRSAVLEAEGEAQEGEPEEEEGEVDDSGLGSGDSEAEGDDDDDDIGVLDWGGDDDEEFGELEEN